MWDRGTHPLPRWDSDCVTGTWDPELGGGFWCQNSESASVSHPVEGGPRQTSRQDGEGTEVAIRSQDTADSSAGLLCREGQEQVLDDLYLLQLLGSS